MAGDETVRVEGLGALIKALKVAEGDLDDLKAANQSASGIVLNAARPLTPVRTGRLAASGRINKAAKKASVVFGKASVPYANPIHWGWPRRNIKANPFVTTAAAGAQDQWLRAYADDIQRILDTVERST